MNNTVVIDSAKQSVMENIKLEAILFVKHGMPMRERGSQWTEYTTECIADAKSKYEYVGPMTTKGSRLTREQRLERRQRKLAAKKGLSFEKWQAIAKSLYKIDGNYNVVSIARGPEHERTFECGSQIEADEKICQLMSYKDYDHFERGHTFAYIPEGMETEETKDA